MHHCLRKLESLAQQVRRTTMIKQFVLLSLLVSNPVEGSNISFIHHSYHSVRIVGTADDTTVNVVTGSSSHQQLTCLQTTSSSSNESFQDGEVQLDSQMSLHYRIHNRMNLSSQIKAPILTIHGGPGLTSEYLYPLKDVVPYRSIVFYDQLGSGKSPGPDNIDAYSIERSLDDLELLLKKLNLRRFHLYGHSYGGILAFEYLKRVAERGQSGEEEEDGDHLNKCLSVILSSTPTDMEETIQSINDLEQSLLQQDPDLYTLDERFRKEYQCRTENIPQPLANSYAHAGTVWAGIDVVKDWKAEKVSDDTTRMPSSMIMVGEYDFVNELSASKWKALFNHPFVRMKILNECSHHGLLEDGKAYGEVVDSFFSEYD